jgi:hypothetical protein
MQKYTNMTLLNFWKKIINKQKTLRKIITIRGEDNIQKAISKGTNLIIRKAEPFTTIDGKICILRNKLTGQTTEIYDFRDERAYSDEYEIVKDWTYQYRQHEFPEEAAYVIPKDIKEGEIVFVSDLIENFLSFQHNQGRSERLQSCKAIWKNNDLEILYFPEVDRIRAVG